MSNNYQKPDADYSGSGEASRISAGSTIKGEINSPYDIRIDGSFEGKICSQATVTVGEKAVIKGDIICSNVDMWGTIEGNLFVKDTLSLKETCSVRGDLHTRRLQVDLDAKFDGCCRMITEEEFNNLTSGEQPAMYDVSLPDDKETDRPKEEIPEA